MFRCIAEGDAVIKLYSTPAGAVLTLQDTVTIHQIPEPMTVALLGLGGLALLRKRGSILNTRSSILVREESPGPRKKG